jgi:hypothetical protein
VQHEVSMKATVEDGTVDSISYRRITVGRRSHLFILCPVEHVYVELPSVLDARTGAVGLANHHPRPDAHTSLTRETRL